MGYCSEVRKFTEACHDDLPNKPTSMSAFEIEFIKKMVNDEMVELEKSIKIEDQADALVDAIYYLCDAAARKGINLDPIFNIVHKANMTKIGPDGSVIRLKNGKIEKPKGFKDPQPLLRKEIKRQVRSEAFKEEK